MPVLFFIDPKIVDDRRLSKVEFFFLFLLCFNVCVCVCVCVWIGESRPKKKKSEELKILVHFVGGVVLVLKHAL